MKVIYWSACGTGEARGQVLRKRNLFPYVLRAAPNANNHRYSLFLKVNPDLKDDRTWKALNTSLHSYLECRQKALIWLHARGIYAYSRGTKTTVVEIHDTPIDFRNPNLPHHNHYPKLP